MKIYIQTEQELERTEKSEVIKWAIHSDWTAPIVYQSWTLMAVFVHNYGGYNTNKASKLDQHPLLRVEDPLSALFGRVSYLKLDLSCAYLQLQPEKSSRSYAVTINTYQGLFRFTCIPFGVLSPPAIFQLAGADLGFFAWWGWTQKKKVSNYLLTRAQSIN